MSISRFRHSSGNVAKPQHQLLNVTSSRALWDGSNTISCNDKFVAVPWQTFGGAAVFLHGKWGKVAPNPPIILGQEGPVIDVKFDPFERQRLFTASEDGSIFGWNIPEHGLDANISVADVELRGHSKKCGVITFHPSAEGVLASAAVDRIINIWDVEKGTAVVTTNLSDYATSLEWNFHGTQFCVVTRDKMLHTIDPRLNSITSSTASHASARCQRCVWCKRKDVILTFGCSESQQRQIKLWDARKMDLPCSTIDIDQSSAAFIPVYDEDTNLLFLGSKGESNIKCYENMEGGLTPCCEINSQEPVKGLCAFPKWCLDVKRCEFDRLYQLTYHSLLTIEMLQPRKNANVEFQADIFPPTFADKPSVSSAAYFSGSAAKPREYDLSGIFDGRPPHLVIDDTECQKQISAALRSADPQEVMPVSREGFEEHSAHATEVLALLPKNKKERHVDPQGDFTQNEISDTIANKHDLLVHVHKCYSEILLLREALHEKEEELLQLLEGFRSI